MSVKNFSKLIFISCFVFIQACTRINKPKPIKVKNFTIDTAFDRNPDTTVQNIITQYKKPLEKEMSKVIAYSAVEMDAVKPESLLTNFVTDLYFEYGKNFCKKNKLKLSIDGAIMNVRGLRTNLPKGEITVGKVYEIMPFDNQLFIVKLRGKHLLKLLDHIARVGGEGVANMQLEILENRKLGKCLVNNNPINKNKLYNIVTIDYLIHGGSGMGILGKKNEGLIDLEIMCRDAIIEKLKKETKNNQKISSTLDKRIYYENK